MIEKKIKKKVMKNILISKINSKKVKKNLLRNLLMVNKMIPISKNKKQKITNTMIVILLKEKFNLKCKKWFLYMLILMKFKNLK